MAGLIRREDIDQVRERARIDEIVGEQVALRPAGVGALKGLCPFHDERTPSFHVRPAQGYYHCFGCGQGGDVIKFVEDVHHLSFTEAVQYLADKTGVTLHYEDTGAAEKKDPNRVSRSRILEANRNAAQFFRSQLGSEEAVGAQKFLSARGFDADVAAKFSLGYAPASWDALLSFLRKRGFTEPELAASGLFSRGQRGPYDRFRGRLIWPISNLTGEVVGFGARRLGEDDKGPKYLNTPETAVYKKSKVLYGIDRAKKAISKQRRIVVVEGYTDVMAAHLAGVECAVATCGTAFSSDHVQIVRRLLGDNADPAAGVLLSSGKARGGEVIFTFDGDEAGQKAALHAFGEDQAFASQTFVAIEPSGKDPCDLWQAQGAGAVRALVDSRRPLFEFVLRTTLKAHNLDTSEGRVAGLRAAAPIVGRIRDVALRSEYTRRLAGWVGMPENEVRQIVHNASRAQTRSPQGAGNGAAASPYGVSGAARSGAGGDSAAPGVPGAISLPDSSDPVANLERQALECLLQLPASLFGLGVETVSPAAFRVPMFSALFAAVSSLGGLDQYAELWRGAEDELGVKGQRAILLANKRWVELVGSSVSAQLKSLVSALVVSPLPQDDPARLNDYARGMWGAMIRGDLARQIADTKARLQRCDPQDERYQQIFAELMSLENRRRQLTQN
ncbi:MAG: DNA primase [Varibaculum cambriense]|uniref:DNA primase n=1 Tax=Varibaculum cambriense TaxID=184870 RepID=UPI001ED22309|nr:DNA primase [Varibaculum cambriense]MBS5918659.1 DNA primase [Varibaculum cambriense]